ncbi:hypothetical protein [Porphyromonas macacae]|nr:hypothetical protein [Porphyromonas macacae]
MRKVQGARPEAQGSVLKNVNEAERRKQRNNLRIYDTPSSSFLFNPKC